MKILKCKMCGGDLFIQPDSPLAVCDYCGTTQTIPALDDEKKLTTYARANRLRQGLEFDKAATLYENIVSSNPEEAEAYWGLVLCKYGISYVDDPKSGQKIPVINRMSYDSIADNEDWKKTYQYASEETKDIYYNEANYIEYIRRGAIEISSKEKPYDIFICYKASDGNGNRTEESVIAQDYYDYLIGKGYKVFFAEITLEEKIGKEFEPIIFAALNSSKVMLVFGTSFDNFNAPWVKNEWMRFLNIMQTDREKILIPCYKDVDPYDMPNEFGSLQAQNLNKIGAKQDILRGISKIIPLEQNTVAATNNVDPTKQLQALLTRLELNFENEDYDSVSLIANQILNISPKNVIAYRALVLAEYKVHNIEDLEEIKEDFKKSKNYKLYYKMDTETQDKLREIETHWAERNRSRNKKKIRKIIAGSVIAIAVLGIGIYIFCINIFNNHLQLAHNLAKEGRYDEALDTVVFTKMAEKRDPSLFTYISAGKLLEQGDYSGARALYSNLGEEYYDVKDKIRKCDIAEEDNKFNELIAAKNYDEAIKIADARRKNKIDGWQQLYIQAIPIMVNDGNQKDEYGEVLRHLSDYNSYGVDCTENIDKEISLFESKVQTLYSSKKYKVIVSTCFVIKEKMGGLSDKLFVYYALARANNSSVVVTDETAQEIVGVLKKNMQVEDASKLVLKNQNLAKYFLAGTWKSGNWYYSMDTKDNTHTNYNIPWFTYGDYYEIVDGTHWLHKDGENPTHGKKLFDISALSENSISIHSYQDGKTYTLTRQ